MRKPGPAVHATGMQRYTRGYGSTEPASSRTWEGAGSSCVQSVLRLYSAPLAMRNMAESGRLYSPQTCVFSGPSAVQAVPHSTPSSFKYWR